MTKKDYELIAGAIKKIKEDYVLKFSEGESKSVASYIADVLAQDNPLFDRWKFYEACGFES